jgi:hypothetical protein
MTLCPFTTVGCGRIVHWHSARRVRSTYDETHCGGIVPPYAAAMSARDCAFAVVAKNENVEASTTRRVTMESYTLATP